MPKFGGELGEEETGTQRCGWTCNRKTPQGLTKTLVQDEGSKGGSAPAQGTAADAGTRRRAQGRAAEAGRWRVRAATRWAELCTGRRGGERVKREGFNDERLWMGKW